MKMNNFSFITPKKKINDKEIILDKKYSQELSLKNGASLSFCSDVGNRNKQEDCIAITENNDYTLLLVADGMGGMNYGEIASYITAKIIKKWLDSEDVNSLKILNKKNLEDVLNALIYIISTIIPSYSGSTLNMSIIGPEETLIANVGDSRTYTIKDGIITLRTKDDSMVFKKYNPQTEEERNKLRFHKKNNILINSISKNTFPSIEIKTIRNDEYDIICHVTDGITDYLEELSILEYCQTQFPAIELVNKSTKGKAIFNDSEEEEFKKTILPGEDNSTAIVYTKKRNKNN